MTRGSSLDRAERAAMYLRDHEAGLSYAKIAAKHGVSRQRIAQVCGCYSKKHFRGITSDQCVYKNLRAWMNSNEISQAELLRRMGTLPYGSSISCLQSVLRGRTYPRKDTIDRLLSVTGLSYRELFEEDSQDEKVQDCPH